MDGKYSLDLHAYSLVYLQKNCQDASVFNLIARLYSYTRCFQFFCADGDFTQAKSS